MIDLSFSIVGARSEPYAAVPTLAFSLRIAESSGQRIHTMMLRCQIQLEPRRRRYTTSEQARLLELFGEPERWGQTVRTVLWTNTSLIVPAFQHCIETDLPLACTYDFEVTAAKYFHALEDGEIPLQFLFSGTVFVKAENGFQVEQVPWEKEASYRLPVRVWRDLMERYFPGSGWIRLRHDSLDALQQFKARRALTSWDDAIAALIELADVKERHA